MLPWVRLRLEARLHVAVCLAEALNGEMDAELPPTPQDVVSGRMQAKMQARRNSETDPRVLNAIKFQSWPGEPRNGVWRQRSDGKC